ncbi:MAG: GNAT family N-acetyltransferase [Planctomycetaceae bacterium]|nr:GNAT family N-acetyltransferase [Planctomycetaceae bacterium]
MNSAGENLFDDYSIKPMATEELDGYVRTLRPVIFRESFEFDARSVMSERERSAAAALRDRTAAGYRLNIGIFFGAELIGWSFGRQETSERFYMTNTAILPEHQGRGIYTRLLPRLLEEIESAGFQIAYSRHVVTNNRVIATKLKAGFVISGLEVTDTFGTLVHLSYYFNSVRREILDVRVGKSMPDEELSKHLGFL